jgi:transcriptional antiterminator NusG
MSFAGSASRTSGKPGQEFPFAEMKGRSHVGNIAMLQTESECSCTGLEDTSADVTAWYVLWTRSNHEKTVFEQLAARNYEVFLPMLSQWSRNRKGSPYCVAPMFRSYLFIRARIDKGSYLEIRKTKGLVSILGLRWDNLATVPDETIATMKQLADSRLQAVPWPYLAAGSEVRITRGTLANTRGILVDTNFDKAVFVVSMDLLQRSVAVNVDCADVEIV